MDLIFLITGGAGFLGSALANRLSGEGHEVRVIDDLSAGEIERLDDKILFTRGDITDKRNNQPHHFSEIQTIAQNYGHFYKT